MGDKQPAAETDTVQAAASRFGDFAELSADLFWELDEQFRFTYLSATLQDIAAADPAQYLGQRWEDLCNYEGTSVVTRELKTLLNGRKDFRDLSLRLTDAHGELRLLKLSGKAVVDDSGGFRGFRGIGVDGTVQRRAMERVQAVESRFVSAVEATSAGFALFDSDGRLVYCNSAWRQHYADLAHLIVPGVSFAALLDATLEHGLIAEAKGREAPWQAARLERHREASGLPVEERADDTHWIRIAEYRTGDGGTVTTWTDITQLKQREAALLESEERYSLAMRGANEGLWDWRIESATVLLSPHACLVIGEDESNTTLPIQAWLERVHPQDRKRWQRALTEHLKGTREHLQEEVRIVGTDGQERWLFIHGLGLRDDVGRVYRMAGSVSDITQRRALEAKARNQELALLQANKMAALGTLVSGVAHEVNNPNNLILMNAQILAEVWRDVSPIVAAHASDHASLRLGGLPCEELLEAAPALLGDIEAGAQRIEKTVRDLKDFAQPHEVALDQDVDINAVVETSAALLKYVIGKKTDSFELDLGSDLPSARGDAQRLEQVLINLLVNALEALPDRTRGVKVETRHNRDEACLEVVVRDQGGGIPAELLERVFDPFFTTKQFNGGTGLGLSISYTLIKEHRGTITFDSQLGQGTTAVVKLPLEFHPD